MCPNEQLLSAFFDGEIEPPYQNSLAEHVESCGSCSGRIERYSTVQKLLKDDEVPGLEESRKRVLERVYEARSVSDKESAKNRFWRRKIVLPLPIAAAAGIMFFLFVGGMTLISLRGTPSSFIVDQRSTLPAMNITSKELAELRELLESNELVVEVNLKLPEEKDFIIIGEPQLMPVKSEAIR